MAQTGETDAGTARRAILAAAGGAESEAPAPLEVDLPADAPRATATDDAGAAFAAALEAAGGRARKVARTALPEALAAATRGLARVHSRSDALHGNVGKDADVAELARLDVAVLHGGPAVAESGAVWWTPADLTERRAAFLAEHVILLVSPDDLVIDLHAAYARVDPAAAPFSCWVCGPSKTADIEQALVVGAHGPRSLEVWRVVGSERRERPSSGCGSPSRSDDTTDAGEAGIQ